MEYTDILGWEFFRNKEKPWLDPVAWTPKNNKKAIILVNGNHIHDRFGQIVRKEVLKYLQVGCTVGLTITYKNYKNFYRFIDVTITKIKDGTFWGEVWNYVVIDEEEEIIGLIEPGDIVSFRCKHIFWVTIDWQPKSIKKKMEKYRTDKHLK